MLDRLEHGKDDVLRTLAAWLAQELPGFLTREIDKQLFADLLTQETARANRGSDAETNG